MKLQMLFQTFFSTLRERASTVGATICTECLERCLSQRGPLFAFSVEASTTCKSRIRLRCGESAWEGLEGMKLYQPSEAHHRYRGTCAKDERC